MALDPNKKFLYFNKDETSAEMDLALCFPVSSFIGIETQSSGIVDFYFEGSKGADANIIRVVHNQQAYIKSFMLLLVNEINFGDNAFIKVHDWGERNTYPSDVSINISSSNPPTFTLEDDDFLFAGDLRVNGKLNFDGIAGVNAIDYNTDFNNSDIRLMTSKAINNRFAQINADTTGNAATATLAADATTLATPRAINGVDFDGSAAITVTAAGSTLSDTVPVSKGGTGATSLTTDGVLFGNGTSAVSAVDLSTSGNIVVGGATPAAVTGANLAGSGLAAAVGNGTLVLAVETLNQDTTGSAATLTTPRAINGVDFDGSAPITVTAAGSTLSNTVTVGKGGTGLTTVAENTMLTGNGTGALTAEANLTYDGTNLQLASDGVSAPDIILTSTSNHVTGSNFLFVKQRADDTPADGDVIGTVTFQGEDDGGGAQIYASMVGVAKETGSGEEGGKLSFNVASHDGEVVSGLIIEDGSAEDEIDVTIASGAASVTTVAGTLTMGSTAALTNAGQLSVAAQPGITSLGTLTALDVDNININLNTISSTALNLTLQSAADLNLVATGNDINVDTDNFTIESSGSVKPQFTLKATVDSNKPAAIEFLKDKGSAGAVGDNIGEIYYRSDNDAQETILYAITTASVSDAADGAEEGQYQIKVKNTSHAGETQNGLLIASNGAVNDVTLGHGAASVTTIAGGLVVATGRSVNVASEAQAPIGMQIARRTITTAEANAMNSTPIELIPAQGANTIIEISSVIVRVDRAATQTNSSADMNLHYADKEPGVYAASSIAHFRRFMHNKTTDIVERRNISTATSAVTLTEDVNKAVEVSFDAATTTNCFTNIDMYVTYFVIDIS